MSRSVDLFIDADVSLDELAGPWAARPVHRSSPNPTGPAGACRRASADAILAEHPYGDDGEPAVHPLPLCPLGAGPQ